MGLVRQAEVLGYLSWGVSRPPFPGCVSGQVLLGMQSPHTSPQDTDEASTHFIPHVTQGLEGSTTPCSEDLVPGPRGHRGLAGQDRGGAGGCPGHRCDPSLDQDCASWGSGPPSHPPPPRHVLRDPTKGSGARAPGGLRAVTPDGRQPAGAAGLRLTLQGFTDRKVSPGTGWPPGRAETEPGT